MQQYSRMTKTWGFVYWRKVVVSKIIHLDIAFILFKKVLAIFMIIAYYVNVRSYEVLYI